MTYFNGKEKIHCQQLPPTLPKKKNKTHVTGPLPKEKNPGPQVHVASPH
jgi:hypothetical protein